MAYNICPDDNQLCPFGATSYDTCKTCKVQPIPAKKTDEYRKGYIPMSVRYAVLRRDNFTCQHCGSQENLSIDHITSEYRGGKATVENCQVLCRSCNSKKGW